MRLVTKRCNKRNRLAHLGSSQELQRTSIIVPALIGLHSRPSQLAAVAGATAAGGRAVMEVVEERFTRELIRRYQ